MKTAVSIPDKLFREVDSYAREHNFSRSEVFTEALREFLGKRESLRLLNALNEVSETVLTPQEKTARDRARKHYAARVLKERY